MAHKAYYKEATRKEKKKFQKYLSEDEDLLLVTGFGTNYIRHRFAFFMLIPGGVCWILGVGVLYYYFSHNPGFTPDDVWRLSVGFGLMLGLFLSMGLAYLLAAWHYHAHRYLLTDRRVIIKKGLFNVRLTGAMWDKITHLEVDQSLIDRMIMKHGDIIINTAGMHKDELVIKFIDHPIEFKNLMEKLINRERVLMGKKGEPVFTVEGETVK